MRCRYNAVNFLLNHQYRLCMARYVVSCVNLNLTYIMRRESMQRCLKYHVTLDHAITALECIYNCRAKYLNSSKLCLYWLFILVLLSLGWNSVALWMNLVRLRSGTPCACQLATLVSWLWPTVSWYIESATCAISTLLYFWYERLYGEVITNCEKFSVYEYL